MGQDGYPIVTWVEGLVGAEEIYVRRWDGASWAKLGAGSAAGGGISSNSGASTEPSVVVAGDGAPVVAWTDNSSAAPQIYVRRWDGASWLEVGLGSASAAGISAVTNAANRPQIVTGRDGALVVAFGGGPADISFRRCHIAPSLEWVGPTHPYLHGTETLQWRPGLLDSSDVTTDLIAYGTQPFTLTTGMPVTGSLSWDTTSVPDDVYELRAVFRRDFSQIVAEASARVVVNNAPIWASGRIESNQVWPAGLYVVEEDLTLAAGFSLTLSPGAIVKFMPTAKVVLEDGALFSAQATFDSPTILTSLADDTAGGARIWTALARGRCPGTLRASRPAVPHRYS